METTLEPPKRGLSLEEAIQEFVRIQRRYSELAEEKRRVMEVLLPAASEVRGQTRTTRLQSNDQKTLLKCEFLSEYKCEQEPLETVKEMLGDDVFETFFKTSYAPRMRELKLWLASASTDERIETAKEIVRGAIKVQNLPPRISIEKS